MSIPKVLQQQKGFFRVALLGALLALLGPSWAAAQPRSPRIAVTRASDRERLAFLSGMSYALQAMRCHMQEPTLVPDLEATGSAMAQQLAFASQVTIFSCAQIQAIVHLATQPQPTR